jgi:hypothetical protein
VDTHGGNYCVWCPVRDVQGSLPTWIESLTGLGEMGRRAQETILAVPDRLRRTAEIIERRSRVKSFSFDLVGSRAFALD